MDMEQIAKLLGVSKTTVHYAIRNTGRLSEKTRTRVLKAVHETGYRPNALARSFRRRRADTLGVVLVTLTNSITLIFSKGWRTSPGRPGTPCWWPGRHGKSEVERELVEVFMEQGADGLIVVPCHPKQNQGYYQGLIEKGTLAEVPAPDSRAWRSRHAAAAFPGRIAADLDAGTGRHGSLRHLSPGLEGSQPLGREHATVPAASAHSAFADRVRMRDVSSRPGRRHRSRGSAPQHAGVGAAHSARALFGILVRPVSLEHAHRHAAIEPGTPTAGPLRLRVLPCFEDAGGPPAGGHDRRSRADPYRGKDHPRMDVRLAQESPGLRGHRGHAQFPTHGCGCARHHGISDVAEYAVSARGRHPVCPRNPPRNRPTRKPAPASTASLSALPAMPP